MVGLGRVAEAARTLTRLVDAAPGYIEAQRLYQDLLVDSELDWVVRSRYAARLLEAPDDADALYLAARIEPDRERQSELFAAAVERNPMHAWARVGVALGQLRAGEPESAAGSAFIAAVMAPAHAQPWLFLGQMQLAGGAPSEAMESLDKALLLDPRSVSAQLGRVVAARELGDAAGASLAALAALRLAPGDRRVIAVASRQLTGNAPPVVVRDALDVTTAALGDVAERWPISVLRARLRLALGDAEGARAEALVAAGGGAGQADVARVARRASIRSQRYSDAVEEFLARAPQALLGDDNLYAERWETLRASARRAQRDGGPANLLQLAESLLSVGWRAEARVVLVRASASVRASGTAWSAEQNGLAREAGRRLARVLAFDNFLVDLAEVARNLRSAARRKQRDTTVREVLDVIGAASERRLGHDITDGATVRSYPFLGEFAASITSGAAFAAEFDRRGLLMVIGRRRGGAPTVMLGRVQLARADASARVRGVDLTFDECWIEAAGLPLELAGLGGGLAGLTIDRFVILQLDTVLSGPGRRRIGLSVVPRPAATASERLALDTPSAVARRIAERAVLGGRDSDAVLASVRTHELGHVFDAREMLPILRPPWRGFWLALRCGFDGAAVEASLEARAAITALAESDAPLVALASLLAFLPDTTGSTAHVEGYIGAVRLAVRIVDEAPEAFPTIDRNFNIIQQFDRLSPAEARDLGQRLLREF